MRLTKIKRVADWTGGLEEREALYFMPVEGHGQPFLVLDQSVAETVETLENIERNPALDRALKWFSLGVRAHHTDEQFTYFWYCIEILAQFDKPVTRVRDNCPKCRAALYCEACKEFPEHRPYPKQAIAAAMADVITGDPAGFFNVANRFRNALMHGDAIEDIEAELRVNFGKLIDQLGQVTWTLLMKKLTALAGPELKIKQLALLRPNMYRHETLTFVSQVFFRGADPDNPRISEMPNVQMSTKFSQLPPTEQPR